MGNWKWVFFRLSARPYDSHEGRERTDFVWMGSRSQIPFLHHLSFSSGGLVRPAIYFTLSVNAFACFT